MTMNVMAMRRDILSMTFAREELGKKLRFISTFLGEVRLPQQPASGTR